MRSDDMKKRLPAVSLTAMGALVVSVLQVLTAFVFTFWQAELIDALTHRVWSGLWQVMTLLPALMALEAVNSALAVWLQALWGLRLRRQQAQEDGHRWMLAAVSSGAGVDKRWDLVQTVVEDARLYADMKVEWLTGFLRSSATLVLFGGLLAWVFPSWTFKGGDGLWVPVPMLLFSVVSFGLMAWLTHLAGRKLPAAENVLAGTEARFRTQVARVRENAMAAALLGGAAWEARSWLEKFDRIKDATLAVAREKAKIRGLAEVLGPNDILAILVLTPIYFSGEISLGQLMQVAMAHRIMGGALDWFATEYPNLAKWRAAGQRLEAWREAVQSLEAASGVQRSTLSAALRVQGLKAWVPARQEGREQDQNAAHTWERRYPDLELKAGSHYLIKAASGWGKSILFSTLGGVWPWASGRVDLPPHTAFIPQKPYFPTADLWTALCYPLEPWPSAREEASAWMHKLQLSHLIPAEENLEKDWNLNVSGGEAARLSLVRALLQKPQWLLMDEPTAPLDAENAALFWRLLSEIPDLTVVLIAHGDHGLQEPCQVIDLQQLASP